MKELDNLDIRKFSTSKKMEEYKHEERLIKINIGDNSDSRFLWLEDDKDHGVKLKDLLNDKSQIVLLGNPGVGKTKELENLFTNLWKEKEMTGLVPFFLNIKNFRERDSLEDLIKYKKWENLDNICFIIDGLDEIPDIQGFVSALELFLEKNDDKSIKVVISCRTNIYEKYLIKIEDFEYFYLENLRNKQITNILKNNFNISISYNDIDKYRVFLENPFNLNLFGNFHLKNSRFPESITEAFELSINQELQLLNKEKFIKSNLIDLPHIFKLLQRIAIANELMQKNGIIEKDLYSLLGTEEKQSVEEISFLEKNTEATEFIFRHKNYQEFLAAQYISELDTDEIINFIKIEGVNKTRSSLFNTISFLLNIIKGEKFNFVKEWLFEYEPEILFLVDREILDREIKKEIFKKYFNDVTVEKTFWSGMDRRFSMEKVAEFADIDYLIVVIKENEHQRRIVKSAFDILSYCKSKFSELEKIKDLLNQYIFSESDYLIDAMHTFTNLNFHREDEVLFLKICEHLKNNESKDVHYQILFMFKDFDNIDDHFEIFKTSLNIECRKNGFNRSNTTWFLEEIILNTYIPENFLEYYNILFNEKSSLRLNDFSNREFEEKLKQKTLDYINENNELIIKIFDIVFNSNQSFTESEEYLFNLFIECNNRDLLFKHITENYGITTHTITVLSLIFEDSLILYFIQKLNIGSIIFQEGYNHESFRSYLLINNHWLLVKKFNDKLIENGYSFKVKLLTQEEKNENNKNYIFFCQNNFDILFDDENIVNGISKFFTENNIEEISLRRLQRIKEQWYKNTQYHSLQNSTFILIQRNLNKNGLLRREELIKNALNTYTRLEIIRNKLDNLNSLVEFKINEQHINWIKKECINFSKIIDFKELNLDNQYVEEFEKFNILKLILYFDNKFNINYTKEFYLTVLRHCNLASIMNDSCFDFIKSRINDLNIFNKQIIENLHNDSLNSKSLLVHIEYALKNKLSSAYLKIKEIILERFESVFYEKLIEDFIFVLQDIEKIEFLKSLIKIDVSYLQWKAINILKSENTERTFLIDFSKKYLNDGSKVDYNSSALDVLFKFNDEKFLEYFYNSILQIEEHQFFKDSNIYGATEKISYCISYSDYNLLKPIFFILYKDEFKDSFAFQNGRQLFQSFIINQSKYKDNFINIRNILIDIKQTIFDKRSLFFYINLIINECELAYYNSLSNPLNFKEAKSILDKIEKPIQQNIMEQFYFGEGSIFNGNQFGGKGNTQTNNFYSYSTNQEVLKAEEILKEFQQLKIENEEWKNIFIKGMKDLMDLKEAETESEVKESKTKLRKIHDAIVDFGKKTNDWKNLVFLPVEFHDKVPKLMELGTHISKLISF